MNLSSPRLPFYSVVAAAVVPWINGIANSNVPGYCFDLVLIGLAGIALAVNQSNSLRMRLSSWAFLISFYSGCFMLFILHRIHPLSDFLVVVPVTLAYALFLSNPSVSSRELLRQLKWLYAFHVCFIIFELFMHYFGLGFVFQVLSGDRYRELAFHFLARIVPDIAYGLAPNSFLLQTQAASHLVASAFALLYLTSAGKRGRADVLVLFGLFLLFLVQITNTSLVVFALLAFAVWMLRASMTVRVSVLIIMLSVGWIFLDVVLAMVFYRVYDGGSIDQTLLDGYWWLFTVPITNLLDAQPLHLLFGHGMDRDALESGEVGLATLVFIGGVYLIGVLLIWLASVLIAGFMSYQRWRNARDADVAAWCSLLFASIVLSAAWAMSTAHYLIIIIPGGMHLFAFGLAIVITATARLRKPWQCRLAEENARGQFRPATGDLSPG